VPFYSFLIHARLEPLTGIVGFYTTRSAYRPDEAVAETKVLRSLRKVWKKKSASLGKIAEIEVEEHWRVSVSDAYARWNSGYTFYREGEEEPEAE
jgi:hypothetical protein